MKEGEGSIPLLCDLWPCLKFQNLSHKELSLTLGTHVFQVGCFNTPRMRRESQNGSLNQEGASHYKYLHQHHLTTSPNLSSKTGDKADLHTDCPAHTVFPSFSLFFNLLFHTASPWGVNLWQRLPGKQLSRFWETKQKASLGNLSVLKHCFLPASAKLNAHCCSFFFNSNVQITACCMTLESLNLLPPRNKAICW